MFAAAVGLRKIESKRLELSAHDRFAKKMPTRSRNKPQSTVSKKEAETALSLSVASCKNDINDPVASVYTIMSTSRCSPSRMAQCFDGTQRQRHTL
jgi:hypothetical protein